MTVITIDKVRASRDGHQFHEAWLARSALALLLPRDGLCAIAVEGLSEEDQEGVSASAVEIADATFYFGAGASFQACSRMEIAQFKYSIAAQGRELRFSDAKKTFAKFASAEADFISDHGATLVAEKLRFALVSNRPMSPRLVEACRAAAAGTVPKSKGVKDQYDQLCGALPWSGEQLRSFALTYRTGRQFGWPQRNRACQCADDRRLVRFRRCPSPSPVGRPSNARA